LRLVVRTATRIVSAIFNSSGTTLTRHADDVTHIAALAMLATGETSFTDAQILLFELAARARLEVALATDPSARFSLLANQAAADALAAAVRQDVANGLAANALPQVGSIVVTPTQFVVQGGTVEINLSATDSEALNVLALVLRPGAVAPEVVRLTAAATVSAAASRCRTTTPRRCSEPRSTSSWTMAGTRRCLRLCGRSWCGPTACSCSTS
jgi:hypothetical protein